MTMPALQPIVTTDPNVNQRAASNPTASVWVNASAGSGKTKVLTERVMRLLLANVKPEKILCLTYTRAGAAEMANRVTDKLSKWATCDDATLDEELFKLQHAKPEKGQRIEARRLFARVLSCPGGLRIRTIHSFCQEILSRFPIEAGLPPHFALIDEQELDVLKNEVLDDLLREAADHPEQELAQALSILVAAQGESGFIHMLQEVVQARSRLATALEQAGSEKNLIARMRAFLQLEPNDTAESLRREAVARIPEADLRQLAAWWGKGSSRYSTRGQAVADFLALPREQRQEKFEVYLGFFLTEKKQPFSSTFVASKEIRNLHPEIDDRVAHEALRLKSVLAQIESADIAERTASVLHFGGAFAARLSARKTARAALDYDDLIHMTERLLTKPGNAAWILYKLDNGLDHILVDEAQDTSLAQWNIVRALTEEFYAGFGSQENKSRTLFVVGDEKQSIFSFQNADPNAFRELRNFFSRRLAEAGNNLEKIGLHTSFRSARPVLDAVNKVFASDSTRAGVSEEPVTHVAFPNPDGSDKLGRVEVWPLLKTAPDETESGGEWIMPTTYEDERDAQAELATQIAAKIKHWTAHHETLPGTDRPVAPGDIMILLRRRGRFADLMVRALKAVKVPVTGVDRMHLIRQLPVMDLLAMVRFVLLPEDDLNLAALLRSPLLGLSEEQLMQLALGRTGSLWQSLQKAETFTASHAYLTAKLNEADFTTPFAFLSQILSAPCPANPDSGRKALWSRLGDEALDPIEELLNEAQSFAQGHSPSLQNFLHWLTQSDTEIKRELDRGGGQVRIMTVHASKGLEAPIVFLPDTVAMPRSADLPKFQWSEDNIPLFLTRAPTFGAALHLWQTARSKQLEEYRRLLYVALTRAANRLYICGWQGGKNEGDLGNSWYGLTESALRPLHQDYTPADENGPIPEILFANAGPTLAQAPNEKPSEPPSKPLPAWALCSIEEQPAQIPVAPSHAATDTAAATPDAAFARGRIIHRLLQSLPDITAANRPEATARFLSHPRHNLTQEQRDEITQEVSQLLTNETFATLFGPDSLAEAPMTGTLNGFKVFRQVDRLCLRDKEVWVVDYKTNRPPPLHAKDIPAPYRQQLAEYRTLLSAIYPTHKIRTFLLWTYAPRLMEV